MLRSGVSALVSLLLLAPSVASAEEPVKIAVLPIKLDAAAKSLPRATLDEIVLSAAAKAGNFKVIGQSDIASMLSFEATKDMAGCDDVSCMVEIGGMLGVEKLLGITIGRVSPNWVVNWKLIDQRTSEVVKRDDEWVRGSASDLVTTLPRIITKALGGKVNDYDFGGGVQITVPRVSVGAGAGGAGGMGEINLEAERALDEAKAVEENPNATPEDRKRVWCKLAGISGKNAYRKQAQQGCDSWRKYIDDLRKLRTALAKDYETLIGYLGLNRPADQKVAIVDAFLSAYGGVSDDARVAAVAAVRDKVAAGETVSLTEDRDGDGVSDSVDRCRDQAGTAEANGCPPSDKDGDGLFDAMDKCPDKAEDVDGHQDGDGCPDNDNDGDGVPDVGDQCPTEKEDHTGDSKNPDGCPGTMAGMAIMEGHPAGTWGVGFVGKGIGDDDFDAGLQWGVGIGLMSPMLNMMFAMRLGTEERDWEPDDPDSDASALLMFDLLMDVLLVSFPRADDTTISPLNLVAGAGVSMGGAQDFSGDIHFSLTPSIANFIIISKSFRVGARFSYPISLAGEYEEPPRFTVDVGLGSF